MLVSAGDLLSITLLLITNLSVLLLAIRRVYVLEEQAKGYRSVIRELRV